MDLGTEVLHRDTAFGTSNLLHQEISLVDPNSFMMQVVLRQAQVGRIDQLESLLQTVEEWIVC